MERTWEGTSTGHPPVGQTGAWGFLPRLLKSFYMNPLVPCRSCRVSVGGWGPVAVGFVTASPELPRSSSGQADGGGSREVAPRGELGGVTAPRAGHRGDLHPWDRGWGWGWPGHKIPWLWEHWGHGTGGTRGWQEMPRSPTHAAQGLAPASSGAEDDFRP